MDYHSQRFADHSLLYYNDRGRLLAVMPANENDGILYSHQGLTYGGLILSQKATTASVCTLIKEMNVSLAKTGIRKVVYKPIPHIYCSLPSEEPLYALTNVCNARLTARSVASVICKENTLPLSQNRRTALNKAKQAGLTVGESNDFDGFWNILKDNLMRNHNATPVHSIEEICLLKSLFPQNIKLYTATAQDGEMMAGVVVYVCNKTVHTQYISATDNGKTKGAVDIIIVHLLENLDYKYFDFGTSTSDNGKTLCESLIFQKEGFGGRAIVADTYEYDTTES